MALYLVLYWNFHQQSSSQSYRKWLKQEIPPTGSYVDKLNMTCEIKDPKLYQDDRKVALNQSFTATKVNRT